jgi:hypothetical protein
MPTTPAHIPLGRKTWNEFYHSMVADLERGGCQYDDDTELVCESATHIAGFRMDVSELPAGTKVRDIKVWAFDELQRTMPTDRRRLYEEIRNMCQVGDNSPIGWLDDRIREKIISTPFHGS